jgi:signal peptidase II
MRRIVLVLLTLLACVGCDQTVKAIAVDRLADNAEIVLPGGYVRLQLAHNPGAFLSLGAALSPRMRQVVLSTGVACMLAALLGYALLSPKLTSLQRFAFALVIGGGAGNLIDRLWRGGYVVDYVHIGVGPLQTGIFNVADVLICLGIGLLLFLEFTRKRAPAVPPEGGAS